MTGNKDAMPNRVYITIDCENQPPIADGVFDPLNRQIEFIVSGDGEVEILDIDLDGFWLPGTRERSIDILQFTDSGFPSVLDKTIGGGDNARILTLEKNRFDIERNYRVKVTCSDGTEYYPDGEHSPPRMVVPRKR